MLKPFVLIACFLLISCSGSSRTANNTYNTQENLLRISSSPSTAQSETFHGFRSNKSNTLLLNTNYQVERLDNTVTNTPIAVYLTLGRIVGSMQCANFEGSYVVKDNEINFHNITLVATGACSTVNYLEQTFISSLKNAERFVMDNVNRKLSIYSPIGSQSIVLRY